MDREYWDTSGEVLLSSRSVEWLKKHLKINFACMQKELCFKLCMQIYRCSWGPRQQHVLCRASVSAQSVLSERASISSTRNSFAPPSARSTRQSYLPANSKGGAQSPHAL